MRQTGDGWRVALLRLSALGFTGLTGVVALGYLVLLDVIGSYVHKTTIQSSDIHMFVFSLALPTLPGAALSWWLLIVRPRHASAPAGGCAGLLAVALAVPGVCVVGVIVGGLLPHTYTPLTLIDKVEAALFYTFWGLVLMCAQPWGWGALLIGGVSGACYGALINHFLPVAHDAEAMAAQPPVQPPMEHSAQTEQL